MDREVDQLAAESSVGKCPLVLIALRSWRLSASIAFVSGMKGARCHRAATGLLQLLSVSGSVSTMRPSGSRGIRERTRLGRPVLYVAL